MRIVLAAFVVLFATDLFAFTPKTGTGYAISTASEPISGVTGRLDCALTVYYTILDSTHDAYFDCLGDGVYAYFEASGATWKIYTVIPQQPWQRCYLERTKEAGSGVYSGEEKLRWNCTGTSSSNFRIDEKDGQITIRSGQCPLQRTGGESIFTGFNQLHRAKVDCADNPTYASPLKIERYSDFVSRVEATDRSGDRVSYFTSDGCSGGPVLTLGYQEVFRPACEFHDACWTNPWKSQKTCDDMFTEKLNDICATEYEWYEHIIGKPEGCYSVAALYGAGVSAASFAYEDDQSLVREHLRNGYVILRFD